MCLTVVTIANMATTLAARCFIWQHYDVIANFVDLDNKAHFEQLVLYLLYDKVDAPPTKVTIPLQSSTFEDDMLDIVNELGAFTISMFAEVKASMNVRAHEHPDNSEVEKSIVADTECMHNIPRPGFHPGYFHNDIEVDDLEHLTPSHVFTDDNPILTHWFPGRALVPVEVGPAQIESKLDQPLTSLDLMYIRLILVAENALCVVTTSSRPLDMEDFNHVESVDTMDDFIRSVHWQFFSKAMDGYITVGVLGWLCLIQGSASSTSMTDASAENVDKFDIHIRETNARLLTTQIGPVLRPSCDCHHLQASDCSDNVTLDDNIDPVLMDHDHESMSVLCEQPPSDGGWTLCNMEDTSIEPPPTPPSPSPLATPPPPPSQALSPPVAPPMASPNADIPASPTIWMTPKRSCDPAPPPQASPPVDEKHTAPATRRFRKLRTTILHNHDVITVQRTTRQLTISVAGKSPMGGWAGDIGWRAMHKHPIPHNNELGHILGAYSVHDLNNGRLILSTQNRKSLQRLERYALHALFLHHQENRAHTGVFLLDELAKWFQDFKPLEDHDLIIV